MFCSFYRRFKSDLWTLAIELPEVSCNESPFDISFIYGTMGQKYLRYINCSPNTNCLYKQVDVRRNVYTYTNCLCSTDVYVTKTLTFISNDINYYRKIIYFITNDYVTPNITVRDFLQNNKSLIFFSFPWTWRVLTKRSWLGKFCWWVMFHYLFKNDFLYDYPSDIWIGKCIILIFAQ